MMVEKPIAASSEEAEDPVAAAKGAERKAPVLLGLMPYTTSTCYVTRAVTSAGYTRFPLT